MKTGQSQASDHATDHAIDGLDRGLLAALGGCHEALRSLEMPLCRPAGSGTRETASGRVDYDSMLEAAAEGSHEALCRLAREWDARDSERLALCGLANEWGTSRRGSRPQ